MVYGAVAFRPAVARGRGATSGAAVGLHDEQNQRPDSGGESVRNAGPERAQCPRKSAEHADTRTALRAGDAGGRAIVAKRPGRAGAGRNTLAGTQCNRRSALFTGARGVSAERNRGDAEVPGAAARLRAERGRGGDVAG